jgi:hypothetical protein
MNLNQSIIKIRVDLQNSTIKKSGKNKHAGFSYYELSDFLPKLNELMLENDINDIVSINNELASITLVKGEERETYSIPFIMFETPLANSGKKMMQDIQYLGALNTYLKRYLYLNAFGITDGEVIDSLPQMGTPKTSSNYKSDTDAVAIETAKGLSKIMGSLNKEENKEYRPLIISQICNERKVDKWSDITFDKTFTYKVLLEQVIGMLNLAKAGI